MATHAEGMAPPVNRRRIAVAGNPNCGKTAVFNALTGLRHKVGNYPGVTVERREGTLAGVNAILLDLPGAYGLSARSPDEEIARDALLGRLGGTQRPDGVLLVIDASNLERNLYLASQILDYGMPAESGALRAKLAAATWPDGRPVLTPLVGVALMVFYVLACQCVGTLAVVKRETNSWRWPVFMFTYMTILAYLAALLVYQIGSHLGVGV